MKIVDMHCDTVSELLWARMRAKEEAGNLSNTEEKGITGTGTALDSISLRKNSGHIDLEKLQASGYLLQNFALFVEKEHCQEPWQQVQTLYALYKEELEKNSDILAPVYTFGDIGRNQAEGKISSLLTVEEGAVCKGEIEKLCKLYEQGVRMMTLTWNYPNELGYPNLNGPRGRAVKEKAAQLSGEEKEQWVKSFLNTPDTEHGLTETGRAFVSKMEELGMIVDVSHLSDAGFYDVLECSGKPFVASHSNARAICPNVRNMSNDMIRKLSKRGGVMGLNFCADFLTQLPVGVNNPGTVDAIVKHARHIINVGGEEVLGLGSDFDGIGTHGELPDASYMYRLFDGLKKGGFTESQIDKIFSENVLRVYREVLAE